MCPQSSSSLTASPPAEPQAEQSPLERTLHGLRLIDEYAWLKAENWREMIPSAVAAVVLAVAGFATAACLTVLRSAGRA
jgi:oligopeptidase B